MVKALFERYATPEMVALWKKENRYHLWRDLWVALLKAQKELGLPIPEGAIQEAERQKDAMDEQRIAQLEKERRHDVMAHLLHFGELAPQAQPYLHLGATSCFITDNTDLILMYQASSLLHRRLAAFLDVLAVFCETHAALPVLGFTHLQPAQPTTLGKRFSLYLYDGFILFEEMEGCLKNWKLRGAKGTTGTQASYRVLFHGDGEKVKALDKRIAELLGFQETFPLVSQTYPRSFDWRILSKLEGLAILMGKLSRDVRLLQHLGEVEEGRGEKQVGSSAMPYKRNPIYAERLTSLSRFLINLCRNAVDTAAEQWLERTLDDSANRRLLLPQAFLTADALCAIGYHLIKNLHIHKETIQGHLDEQRPFLLMEPLLMKGVLKGADRQHLHERLRQVAMAWVKARKNGKEKDLFQVLLSYPDLPFQAQDLETFQDLKILTGRAEDQVKEFLKEHKTQWEKIKNLSLPPPSPKV